MDGVPLNKLPKEDLVQILEANISSGLMRRYEHDLPFAKRSRDNVQDLILERVVEPQVEATWGLFDSIFARGSIIERGPRKVSRVPGLLPQLADVQLHLQFAVERTIASRRPHCDTRLPMGCLYHNSVFVSGRGWGRDLLGRICAQGAVSQPSDPDQHQQSRRRTFNHLRHVRSGDFCSDDGVHYKRRISEWRRYDRQWAYDHLG